MSIFTAEEWNVQAKLVRTKMRLRRRQLKLVHVLNSRPETFRADPKVQTELRRVGNLCNKIGVSLHHRLHQEIFGEVHDR